jgi:hypothetical protein
MFAYLRLPFLLGGVEFGRLRVQNFFERFEFGFDFIALCLLGRRGRSISGSLLRPLSLV